MLPQIILVAVLTQAGAEQVTVSPSVEDEQGFLLHTVQSPYQASETQIRVLLPSKLAEGRLYPVVYVLPVEEQGKDRYGDGLIEVLSQELNDKHAAIFVAPTFSRLPWYVDHPADLAIRQESYFIDVVVPFVEKTYPVIAQRDSRLLLGFSKSGWGAWSLLLRHPERFARAAAWDSPMMMDVLGKYGTTPIIGTEENLAKYRVADLLGANGDKLGDSPRLILSGYGNFRQQHEQMHELLIELEIPHHYQDGPQREHDWHSGWVPELVELLLKGE